jgi:hypothetical protein
MDTTLRVVLMTKAWVEANRMELEPADFYVCFANLEMIYAGRKVTYGLSSTAHVVAELYGLESWSYDRFERRPVNTASDMFDGVHYSHTVLSSTLRHLMDFLHVSSYTNEYVVDLRPIEEETDESEEEVEDGRSYVNRNTGVQSFSGMVPLLCADCSEGTCADCRAYSTHFNGEKHQMFPYDPSYLDQ